MTRQQTLGTMLMLLSALVLIPNASAQAGEEKDKKVTDGKTAVTLSGVEFTPPEGWHQGAAKSSMRAAEFTLPAKEKDADEDQHAELVVYYFGPGAAGTVQANIARWVGQFKQPDGGDSMDAAKVDKKEINGLRMDTVDVSGTYVAMTRPGSGQRMNKPDHRMRAVIVHTEAGPYYVKLVGPSATVDAWDAGFEKFMESMKPAPMTHKSDQ